MNKYILNEKGKPTREPDLMKWADWFGEIDNRRVLDTYVGDLWVSTIFLGIDYSFGNGAPLLWETMVLDQKGKEKACDRCAGSREQAEAMHALMVRKIERQK